MEPERRRARADGRKYEPKPVTFNFHHETEPDGLRVLIP